MQAARCSGLPQAGWQAAAGTPCVQRLCMACTWEGLLQGLATATIPAHLHHLQAAAGTGLQGWCMHADRQPRSQVAAMSRPGRQALPQ